MIHMTAGIFGNYEFSAAFVKKLGKQGTTNDITIYNHGSSEGIFTYVGISSDKIQTLLQVINMIDTPVIAINEITASVGEQLIAISEFGFDRGFMILDNISEDQIKSIVKGTCIENFSLVHDAAELVQEMKKLNIERKKDGMIILIDNYFNVKSVGTVILGIIKTGSIKKYDKVIVEPLEKEVMIKGIQSQDKDIDSAKAGMRVGLSLKGVEADEIKRGYVIGNISKTKKIKLNFRKSKYYKDDIKENDQIFISSGLQVVAAKIKSLTNDILEADAETYITYTKDTRFLVASTKQQVPRIIGKGLVCNDVL